MKAIPLTPKTVEMITDFCDPGELEMRARMMGELVALLIESDDIDDHTARDYARALLLLEKDLNMLLTTTQETEDHD